MKGREGRHIEGELRGIERQKAAAATAHVRRVAQTSSTEAQRQFRKRTPGLKMKEVSDEMMLKANMNSTTSSRGGT
jgi:hypothetical protein